jgi:hypothetical protein
MNHSNPTKDEPPGTCNVVRCTVCKKTTTVSDSEVARFIESGGWPRCCDLVMTLQLVSRTGDSNKA